MRTERFNGTLLSTLILVSLMVPAITLLSVGLASANPDPEDIVVQGNANNYNTNVSGVPPWKPYKVGDFPPIMAAKKIGSGAVVAAGLARTTNGGVGYPTRRWTLGELDVLFDNAFQWMVPGATDVLWYGEYIPALEGTYEYVYNDAERGSWLIDVLEAKGYSVDNTIDGAFTPITPDLLSGYDILVIPQLQVGDGAIGGDPTQLPDNVPGFIKNFVDVDGKGLFIMDAADIDGYNFYKVHEKILRELDFGLYFQPDTVQDDTAVEPHQFNADVNTLTYIGSAYENETGKTTLQVYKVCSLAPELEDFAVSVEIMPSYREGLAGGTLKYELKVTNVGKTTDNYNLEPSDNIWPTTISPPVLELENNFTPQYATLSVMIPQGTPIGTEDSITVTATSDENAQASSSSVCLAIVENRVRPSTADAQVVEAEPDDNYGERFFMYVGSSATGIYKNERTFMRFDLEALGTEAPSKVRLYLYSFAINGTPDQTVELLGVSDDTWKEVEINWGNQPSLGSGEDNETVIDTDVWCSWDVTEFVQSEFAGDKVASFALSYPYPDPSENYPDNWSYGFRTKEYRETFTHPYLAVGGSVSTEVRATNYNEGLPGGTLSYNILVQNTGALDDSYTLTVIDNMGWGPKFLATGDNTMPLALDAGDFDNAMVTVTIPPGASIGENIDNLLVIATSDNDSTISDNCWFVANVSNTNIRPPEDDSTAKEADPVGNWFWGTWDGIEVGRESGGPDRGFLKFDLSAIGTNVAGARLWLNAEEVDDVGAVVRVHEAGDSWVERGSGRLMGYDQPSIGEALDVRAVVEAGRQYFWDVTSYVLEQRAGDNVASFALVDLGENIPPDLHRARFTSKESENTEGHPYLEILTTEPTYDVRTYISPIFQGGIPGTTLNYTVTVKNKGTSSDTYALTVNDDLGWGATVSPTSLPINAGASDTATLSVTVPDGTVCTLDRITVIATGTGVSDDALCYAHLSKSTFKLENLYKISIDLNLRLRGDADNLVAKFYTYTDAYQAAYLIHWENMPYHLISMEYIPHPKGEKVPVENVHLVLEDGGAEIATVATWTVRRTHLIGRISKIKGIWPFATPPERSGLMQEISGIKGQWAFAPP